MKAIRFRIARVLFVVLVLSVPGMVSDAEGAQVLLDFADLEHKPLAAKSLERAYRPPRSSQGKFREQLDARVRERAMRMCRCRGFSADDVTYQTTESFQRNALNLDEISFLGSLDRLEFRDPPRDVFQIVKPWYVVLHKDIAHKIERSNEACRFVSRSVQAMFAPVLIGAFMSGEGDDLLMAGILGSCVFVQAVERAAQQAGEHLIRRINGEVLSDLNQIDSYHPAMGSERIEIGGSEIGLGEVPHLVFSTITCTTSGQ